MVQVQALNNMLNNNNIDKYLIEGITADYFNQYENEYKFILKHYKAYNKAPDWETFMGRFPDFTVVEVLEPVKYIIYNLKEEYLYKKSMKILQECASKLDDYKSFEALNDVITKSQQLLQNNDIKYGTSIQDMGDLFEQDVERKRALNNAGIIGITSGFTELDEITHGWLQGDELVTIVGRVNQGKSWVLQKFLAEANKQGKRVLIYSGEMSKKEVMYRHLTLKHGISNTKLMTGDITKEEQTEYKQLLANDPTLYHIVTPNDLGGEQLTVTKLKMLALQYRPDIIGIDQLSLMKDERKQRGDGLKEQFAHISQDLFNLSGLLEVPILLAAQANRGRTSENKVENPELSNIAGSDDVGANSSRVISLTTKDGEMTLKLIKNRYGKVGWESAFPVNLDVGNFKAYPQFRNRNKNKDKYINDEF